MKDRHLPSLHDGNFFQNTGNQMISSFKKKKLSEEATAIASGIINEQTQHWRDNEAKSILEDQRDLLLTEVSRKVREIENDYRNIQIQMYWNVEDVQVKVKGPGWAERVVAGGLGLVLGVDVAIVGVAGGWKEAAIYAAGHLAVAIPLALLGAPLLPVIVPAGIVTGLVTNTLWGASNMEKQLKEETARLLLDGDSKQGIQGLQGEPARVKPELERLVNEHFGEIEGRINATIGELVQAEEYTLQTQLEDAQREGQDKKQLLAQIRQDQENFEQCRRDLVQILIGAKQG